jgi:hypothetical protein
MTEPPDPEPRVDRTAFSIVSSFDETDAEDDAFYVAAYGASRYPHRTSSPEPAPTHPGHQCVFRP